MTILFDPRRPPNPPSKKFVEATQEREAREVLLFHLASSTALYVVSTGKQWVAHVCLLYIQPVSFPTHSAARAVMTSYELIENRRTHVPYL